MLDSTVLVGESEPGVVTNEKFVKPRPARAETSGSYSELPLNLELSKPQGLGFRALGFRVP